MAKDKTESKPEDKPAQPKTPPKVERCHKCWAKPCVCAPKKAKES